MRLARVVQSVKGEDTDDHALNGPGQDPVEEDLAVEEGVADSIVVELRVHQDDLLLHVLVEHAEEHDGKAGVGDVVELPRTKFVGGGEVGVRMNASETSTKSQNAPLLTWMPPSK